MTQYWNHHYLKLVLSGILAKLALLTELVLVSGNGDRARAQIIPDDSLGAEASVVTPNVEIKGLLGDRIDGGAIRDTNLFHSFQEFNIGDLQRVYFANPEGIANIFSRVTGSNLSEIFGTLGVNGNANLFFINPNGIIFGENASLDVGGSFAASTADAIQFGDRGFFSATEPEQPPLLTVQPSAFFFNQIKAGRIENRSTAPAGVDLLERPLSGLRVPDGQSLLLVGGDIAIDGGGLNALDGQVELAGVAGDGTVGLNVDGSNLNLSFPETLGRADISLSNEAFVNTSGDSGGSIQVQGSNVTLRDRSNVIANTNGSGNSGGIVVRASQLSLKGGSRIITDVVGSGQGGNLTVNATESVRVTEESADGVPNTLGARTFGTGNGGDLSITTGQLLIKDRALIETGTFGEGDGGNLTVNASESVELIASGLFADVNPGATGNAGDLSITTRQLIVRDLAQIGAGTFGEGDGGNLTVNASESVQLIVADLVVSTQGKGKAGDLNITTRQLLVKDGAQIGAGTFGEGDGGSLTVNASESVQLIGPSANSPFTSGLFVQATPGSTGKAGDLSIITRQLLVKDGAQVRAGTRSEGDGGILTVNASESVQLIGTSADGQFGSGLFVQAEGTGNAGDLRLDTGSLILLDGAVVNVNNQGAGNAGRLEIQARSLSLDNQGAITATTRSGDGGDITLKVQDLLLLRRNSQISTTAGTAESGGDGGDINIAADLIVTFPQENSDITANAFEGKGGNINIDAQNIFGFQLQENPNLSDITASSERGLDGTVNINTSGLEPGQELIELPIEIVDVSRLINQNLCLAGQEGEFIITGKGGLSPSPQDTLNTDAGWEDWRMVEDSESKHQESSQTRSLPEANNHDSNEIIEAQSWFIAPNGKIVLSAKPTTVQSQDSRLDPFDCRLLRERE